VENRTGRRPPHGEDQIRIAPTDPRIPHRWIQVETSSSANRDIRPDKRIRRTFLRRPPHAERLSMPSLRALGSTGSFADGGAR